MRFSHRQNAKITLGVKVEAKFQELIRSHTNLYKKFTDDPDSIFRRGDPLAARLFTGPVRPKRPILGGLFSGKVAAVGPRVTRFEVGDAVFGSTAGFGTNAE